MVLMFSHVRASVLAEASHPIRIRECWINGGQLAEGSPKTESKEFKTAKYLNSWYSLLSAEQGAAIMTGTMGAEVAML